MGVLNPSRSRLWDRSLEISPSRALSSTPRAQDPQWRRCPCGVCPESLPGSVQGSLRGAGDLVDLPGRFLLPKDPGRLQGSWEEGVLGIRGSCMCEREIEGERM